jgi:nitrogen regulatory protein PII-like uncharacterized protein
MTSNANRVANVEESEDPEKIPRTTNEMNQQIVMRQSPLDITVITPTLKRIVISSVNPSEQVTSIKQILQDYQETAQYTNYSFEIDGTVISEYMEIGLYASQVIHFDYILL